MTLAENQASARRAPQDKFSACALVFDMLVGLIYKTSVSAFYHFKTGQFYAFVTGEGGLVPLSKFKKHRGLDTLITVGAVWNADKPSALAGPVTTATWPWVFSRFIVPKSIRGWAHVMLNLARYNVPGSKLPNRQGVVQLSQSLISRTVEVAFGLSSYNFAWTIGYASPVVSFGEIGHYWGQKAQHAVGYKNI